MRGGRASVGDVDASGAVVRAAAVLPVDSWSGEARPEDEGLLAACSGATIDLGCGPGRLAAALHRRGHRTLGVDVVEECVARTRARGVHAVHCSLFDPVPEEGRWSTALLADGNVGIGGDPVALLRRAAQVLAPGGRVVAELAGPGVPFSAGWMSIEVDGARCRPFRWAVVGVDDVHRLADLAGLAVRTVEPFGSRWLAVLDRGAGTGVGVRMVG
ncbi:class I SAM-dependent methyltransferase [Nocardioides sp. GY 10127]|nr:class I SAM-dependent methyltransferase [Nocardioides sp. GY 10127]